MRRNEPVTQREKNYPSDSNLISTTDLKGQIRYANEDFCKVSGYTSEELHGRPHNLIRHPDMPPAAFADLWKTIQGGQSWMGIVKNRCKNGDHYWVDAFVSPIRSGNQTVEYQSVRTKPDRQVVARAERLYQTLNQSRQPRQLKWPQLSFKARLALYRAGGAPAPAGIPPGANPLACRHPVELVLTDAGGSRGLVRWASTGCDHQGSPRGGRQSSDAMGLYRKDRWARPTAAGLENV